MAAEASARRPAAFSQRHPKAEEGGEPRPKEEAADEPLPLAAQPYPQTLPGTCAFWARFPQKTQPQARLRGPRRRPSSRAGEAPRRRRGLGWPVLRGTGNFGVRGGPRRKIHFFCICPQRKVDFFGSVLGEMLRFLVPVGPQRNVEFLCLSSEDR